MAKILSAAACVFVLWGCTPHPDLEALRNRLLEVDREFSRMSLAEGTGAAFLAYMAEEATVYPYKGTPIQGRKGYRALISQTASTGVKTVLQWEPSFADVGRSGDLGYTLGTYRAIQTMPDGSEQVRTGNYITIWKQQEDESWKFVFDGGNQH